MKSSNLPNLRHLRLFELVARLKSVSLAATEARLSQPSVTQAIAKMEQRFAARLFERRRSGSYLTAAGLILLARVHRLFEQIEESLRDFTSRSGAVGEAALNHMAGELTGSHLRVLISVAETGSFDQAARAIGISHSSLHRIARDLERTLRRPLFERTVTGMSTTRAGTELARRLTLAALEVDYAAEQINAAQGNAQSRISIGVPQLGNSTFLAEAIRKLVSQYPQAQVDVAERPLPLLLEDLRFGKLDLIYGLLNRVEGMTDVVEEPLFSDPHSIVVRSQHPLVRKPRISVTDLADYDWITPEAGAHRRDIFEQIFSGHERTPRTAIQTISLTLHLYILSNGDSIGILKKEEIETHEMAGLLTTLPFALPAPKSFVGITTRAGWQPTPLKQALLELMRELARHEDRGVDKPFAEQRQARIATR